MPEDFLPPSEPPSLIPEEQLLHLLKNGWLFLPIAESLQTQINNLSEEVSRYFDRLGEDKKRLYPASQGTENGFYFVEGEKEYVTFRYCVGAVPELERQAGRVWLEIASLLHRVLCDIARSCDIPASAWDQLLCDSLELPKSSESLDTTTTLLRLFRYYPSGGFAAQHVDIGLLTLCVGDGKGLQVLDTSQQPPEWIDVEGPTLLVGETVKVLSEGMIRAGAHRVQPNENGRTSTVFTLRPSLKETIDLSVFGFEGTLEAKRLWAAIKGSKVNINATKEIREQMKAKRDAKMAKGKAESED
ncbi:hypothetical protein EV356DRAFT_172945 [Viridothelium virens]|uniref:Fe2OG dioxygenase domain-containing protein n=1 Tax=Viridothelium virens TaxID=1048519 RepID=A0A6A6H806_VIRVR|nr:hypothetical protein EV356DRAFT_172945 [Viridothelium virens]